MMGSLTDIVTIPGIGLVQQDSSQNLFDRPGAFMRCRSI